MREQAEAHGRPRVRAERRAAAALVRLRPVLHEGVVGIVASRLKERLHRPSFVFALGQDGRAEGLGPLDRRLSPARCARPRQPSAIPACSCVSAATRWRPAARSRRPTSTSSAARCERRARRARRRDARAHAHSDGPLAAEHFDAATVRLLEAQVWGAALRRAAVLRRGRGRLAAPGRREAPQARRCASAASSATRSGSAASSRSTTASASPGASASTPTTASSACR